MHKRIEIEEVENGVKVVVWKEEKEDENGEEMMYPEPKTFVFEDVEDAVNMVRKKFTKKKES